MTAAEWRAREREEARRVAELAAVIRENFPEIGPEEAAAWAQRQASASHVSFVAKIAAMQRAFFADVDALEESGKVELPN